MKVVVTGGDGFIGSHLVDALITMGHAVTVVDTLEVNGGRYINSSAALEKISVKSPDLPRVFSGAQCVFHLAALPRIQPSIVDPARFHDVNVNGTFNVLMAAKEAGVKRVIYSASSSVYGDQETLPLHEGMKPCPKNPYALQKLVGEMYCALFSELYGLHTVSLRYFNVYGPRQPESGAYATVIGIFLRQWLEKEPLTIVPDGRQTRDFTHVKDIVRANILAMETDRVGRGEVINIGTGMEYSILEVADFFGGEKKWAPERRGEARRTCADVRKAKELLGWEPTTTLPKGIRDLRVMALSSSDKKG